MSLELVPFEVMHRVARVLLEKGTQSIRFKIGKYSVTGFDYETIAIRIYAHHIDVAYGDLKDMADSGGVAYYQGSSAAGPSDVLYLPRACASGDLSLDTRSIIVHEATHAVFDDRKIAMRRLDGEMLAYFAQFWYGKANHFDPNTINRELGTMTAVLGYGFDCVRQYQANDGRIDRENLEGFRNAILALPLYCNANERMAAADGIGGLSYSGQVTDPWFRRRVLDEIRGAGGLSDPH